jgi:hypothetical protein
VLAIAACIIGYVRRRAWFSPPDPRVDDDAVRTILATGSLNVDEDEPLDLREIGEEEERFWSETWDEPEESDFGGRG